MRGELLTLRYLKYTVDGEVACARKAFSGMGASPGDMAHFPDPNITRNMETINHEEKDRRVSWSQI